MNEWDRRIREHRVWSEMQSLGPAIDIASDMDDYPETIPGIARLRAILAFTGKRIAAADPLLVTPAPLEEMANAFATIHNELDNFANDKITAHVQNANIAADRVLAFVSQIPGDYSPEELGGLVSAALKYRQTFDDNLFSATNTVEEFNGTSEAIRAKLADLASSIQLEQQKLAQVVTDYQGQFSASQEKRGQEYTDTLRSAQQDLTRLVVEYQSQFSTGQDARGKEYASAQSAHQTKFNELLAEYSQRLIEQNSQFTTSRVAQIEEYKSSLNILNEDYLEKANDTLKKIEERQEHVENLVGVIGNLGVTSGYLKTANRAQRSMWLWQGVTVAAMIVLCTLAYRTLPLLEDGKGQFNWGGFAGRVVLLCSLGVLAAYAGSQADKLFDDEKRNRKFALELEAIGPFLAPLPIEEQNKFRAQIGGRSFGRNYEFQDKGHKKSPATLFALIKSKEGKEFIEIITDIVKKAK